MYMSKRFQKSKLLRHRPQNGVRRLQKHSPEMVRFLDRSVLSETQERPNRSSCESKSSQLSE
ncbi:hypothetical protein AHF37_12043 [Paragonimus kellicotti]|nr:hypothetical protein AHF37_12043 [Paragonimus kellicotti]